MDHVRLDPGEQIKSWLEIPARMPKARVILFESAWQIVLRQRMKDRTDERMLHLVGNWPTTLKISQGGRGEDYAFCRSEARMVMDTNPPEGTRVVEGVGTVPIWHS